MSNNNNNTNNKGASASATSSYSLPARGIWEGDWATDAKLKLVSDSYINFISVPKILDFARQETLQTAGPDDVLSIEVMQYAHKISRLYRKRLGEYIAAAEAAAASSEELDAATFQQTESLPLALEMRSILHLAETFYLPADGIGDGVVGEALIHWLNHSRPGPSNEIAEDFMSAATPYFNQEFLPFINKCILRGYFSIAATLLTKFEDHHPIVKQLADETAQLISTIPRSPSFTDARTFLTKRHEWTERVKVLQSSLQADFDDFEADRARDGNESEGNDERLDLEVGFMILLGTLAGDSERILEASESWQEALGAWGLLVQPSMTREDVQIVVGTIFERCAVTAEPADEVQAALVRGEPVQAALLSRNVDPWLAAHLIDLFDRVELLLPMGEGDATTEVPPNLRAETTMAYAEMILEDQGLWRVAIDYFALSGSDGQHRLREVLLTVPLTDEEEEALAAPGKGKGKQRGKGGAKLQGQGLQDRIRDTNMAHQKTMKRIRALNASATGGTVWGGAEDAEHDDVLDEDEDNELETGTHTSLDPNVMAARRERKRRRLQRERELAARSIEVQRVEDVLEVCQEHELNTEARAVCLKMADAMLCQKRYNVALEYSARAQDERHIGRIADFLLDQYFVLDNPRVWLELIDQIPRSLLRGNAVAPGPPGAPDELDEFDEDEGDVEMSRDGMMELDFDGNTTPGGRNRQWNGNRSRRPRLAFGQGLPVNSPRLRFLAKYRDFQRLYGQHQWRRAAAILVEVLAGRLAPARFWSVILLDTATLLESEHTFFDAEQTFELMRCLEHICSAARANPIEAKLYFGSIARLLNSRSSTTTQQQEAQVGGFYTPDRLAILREPDVDLGAALERMAVVRHLLSQQLARNIV
ncbi:hypothetical protein OC834_003913 [Tilletia horrida]|nr:hypothetical protein OC834_003913 [Tilletia horrida]